MSFWCIYYKKNDLNACVSIFHEITQIFRYNRFIYEKTLMRKMKELPQRTEKERRSSSVRPHEHMKDAIILAATKGTRMAPLSDYLPKCLLPLYDKPLIVYQIELLEEIGIQNIYITLEPVLGPLIEKSLESGYPGGAHLHFRYQTSLAGIGYATLLFKNDIHGDFLVLLADEYFTSNDFLHHVGEKDSDITLGLAVYESETQICKGCNVAVDEKAQKVKKLIEKPSSSEIMSNLCWTGFARFTPHIFSIIQKLWDSHTGEKELDLTTPIQKAVDIGMDVSYIIESGVNVNITTIGDYIRVLKLEEEKR
jgi:dTDP-glucose pyrophosphorylase